MLTAAQLDQEYNARAAIPDHPEIFARWRRLSVEARDELRYEDDYYYGPSPDERLDIFSAGRNSPLLVFIHGGYWRSLDKTDFGFLAPAFVKAGISVALTNYGLAPATRIEDMVRQQLRALNWLYHHLPQLGIDREQIVLAGHSAGAHLAAMLLAADWPAWAAGLPPNLIKGAVCVSGIYDLEPLAETPFLAADLQLDAARARFVSPIHYRPPRALPLITAVGSEESSEFQRQNGLLHAPWAHCFRQNVSLPGRHHLNAIEALGEAEHPLFKASLRLFGKRP